MSREPPMTLRVKRFDSSKRDGVPAGAGRRVVSCRCRGGAGGGPGRAGCAAPPSPPRAVCRGHRSCAGTSAAPRSAPWSGRLVHMPWGCRADSRAGRRMPPQAAPPRARVFCLVPVFGRSSSGRTCARVSAAAQNHSQQHPDRPNFSVRSQDSTDSRVEWETILATAVDSQRDHKVVLCDFSNGKGEDQQKEMEKYGPNVTRWTVLRLILASRRLFFFNRPSQELYLLRSQILSLSTQARLVLFRTLDQR